MNRRDFLRLSAVAAGSAVVHPQGMLSLAKRDDSNPQGSLLETASSDSPIDTVVVVMLENRSVDHYLGWLGTDERYRVDAPVGSMSTGASTSPTSTSRATRSRPRRSSAIRNSRIRGGAADIPSPDTDGSPAVSS
ncbi:MAG: twin-arginine translocation signal domain-containing protein [Actinobacteria bacterium]|nr:MAG: twin-arginine translocation signal domain-containing protein [Actinomycetota bacterium]